ncbi:MAG: cellulase family glycosylhydrolase [Eggerthellaceae bacterium]|nr:cellulase family glycosylhydrolase [Eggerthellaceae bacterium]
MSKAFKRVAVSVALAVLVVVLSACSMQGAGSLPASSDSAGAGSSSASAAVESSGTEPAASSGLATPATAGALHVEGTRLVGEHGEAVQLKGASTHGLAWFPAYVNDALFGELRTEWGANVVRLAMYTAESGGYCADGDQAALRKLVDDGVRFATDNDLYVIIDWHILSDNDPNMHADEAEVFFAEVSATYTDHDNVLYEICNEPNGGTTWASVKAYAERIVPVIRANDSDAVIIVGTPTWSQDVDAAAADPLAFDNVMYALHFYAATHKEDLRAKATSALDAGLPLFVSEFGICDASGNGAIDETQADAWVSLLDERGVSYVMWNLSNKAESSAMFKATCDKVSGFADDDLSQAGTWLKRTLAGKGSATASGVEEQASGDAASSNAAGQSSSGAAPAASASASPVVGAESPAHTSGNFEYRATLRTSWESNGESFFLYDLAIVNNGVDTASWSIDLPFNGTFALSDSWNGTFQAEGNTLHVSNVDYNGAVTSGGSVADVGFIVSGAPTLALQ